MKYVLSLLSWRSVTTSKCARPLLSTSSPVRTSNNAIFPDSWPVTMIPGVQVNAHTVAFDPIGWNKWTGSFDSVFSQIEGQKNILAFLIVKFRGAYVLTRHLPSLY
jgi:hypothetical protein